MSYDNWKLSNPQDDGWASDEVTSCCGVDQEGSGLSNCCDAKFYLETDICSACKEHAEEYMICTECGYSDQCYTMIELHEYQERRREDAQEYNKDE
tara:strand:+ start:1903 stop:2190 length:288 start_codon:yes stop_codon:yes gene_type:complete